MEYSFELLLTVAECDSMVAKKQDEKSALDVNVLVLQQRQNVLLGNSKELNDEFASNQIQVDSLTSTLATLPEGKVKKNNAKSLRQLNNRQDILTERKESLGGKAVLEVQHDLNKALADQAELVVLLTGLQGRRTQLGGT